MGTLWGPLVFLTGTSLPLDSHLVQHETVPAPEPWGSGPFIPQEGGSAAASAMLQASHEIREKSLPARQAPPHPAPHSSGFGLQRICTTPLREGGSQVPPTGATHWSSA